MQVCSSIETVCSAYHGPTGPETFPGITDSIAWGMAKREAQLVIVRLR